MLLQAAEGGTLNHLGVETETAAEVAAAESRLTDTGLATTGVDDTVCCFAEKVETWVNDPDGAPWEWYVKTADSDDNAGVEFDEATGAVCCATPASAPVAFGSKAETAPSCG